MRATKRNTLTTKERALVRGLSKGKSLTQAALDAGYSGKNPGQSGWQAFQNIRLKMPELLDTYGLTDEILIEKHLKPLLDAKETRFFQSKGKVKAIRHVPANGVRMKALDMAFRLRGSYARIKPQDPSQKTVPVIVLDVPRPPRIARLDSHRRKRE